MEIVMEKPVIDYPCLWTYKIIGQDEQLIRNAAENAAINMKYTIETSNKSAGGKYHSISLDIHVNDDAERLAIYEKLKKDTNVKIVM